MADVAARARVSTQTVSRVANNHQNVHPETRRRVLEVMRDIGYRPNLAARALVTGKFGAIGVVTFDVAAHGNSRTLEAIVSALQDTDYLVNLISVRSHTGSAVLRAFERLKSQAVDGIILNEAQVLDTPVARFPPGMPLVITDGDGGHPHPVVQTDHAEGVDLAVGHLLGLGHRTVWHLAGPPDSYPARRRVQAWRATLQAAGAPSPPVLHGDWSGESGYHVGRQLATEPDLTAVFCANDQMALGAMKALHEAGRRVPEDVSVVGFDNLSEAAFFQPGLTTVDPDFDRIGRLCVTRLLEQIQERPPAVRRVQSVPPRLIVRDSTASPRH
ncbi:LacI family DNA-binding transcriptional regulator [Streptomyces sp. NPDC059352]|uniref:LacI family DNA-binding transcriptional regulator n=1 Tax=Streptomyces sp. NPDC059352 TaxID=3346810 RepID=UPI003695672D